MCVRATLTAEHWPSLTSQARKLQRHPRPFGGAAATDSNARPTPQSPLVQEYDPAPHFVPLLELLAATSPQHAQDDQALVDHVARGVAAARAASIPPEQVLAYLRRRLHEAPIAEVGDWQRGALIERLVGQAIEAYYPDTGARDSTETPGSNQGPA